MLIQDTQKPMIYEWSFLWKNLQFSVVHATSTYITAFPWGLNTGFFLNLAFQASVFSRDHQYVAFKIYIKVCSVTIAEITAVTDWTEHSTLNNLPDTTDHSK